MCNIRVIYTNSAFVHSLYYDVISYKIEDGCFVVETSKGERVYHPMRNVLRMDVEELDGDQ